MGLLGVTFPLRGLARMGHPAGEAGTAILERVGQRADEGAVKYGQY